MNGCDIGVFDGMSPSPESSEWPMELAWQCWKRGTFDGRRPRGSGTVIAAPGRLIGTQMGLMDFGGSKNGSEIGKHGRRMTRSFTWIKWALIQLPCSVKQSSLVSSDAHDYYFPGCSFLNAAT